MWDDCIQNEIRKNHNRATRQDEEENVALATKGKRGKSKKGAFTSWGKGNGKQKEGKEDLSKVKC